MIEYVHDRMLTEQELKKMLKDGENVLLMVQVPREDIINVNLTKLEQVFKLAAKFGKKMRESVGFTVSGYDDYEEEVFEIPEIRNFIDRLFRKMSYIAYYLTPQMNCDEWVFNTWADEVKLLTERPHPELTTRELVELYDGSPPPFRLEVTISKEKLAHVMNGVKRHGKVIKDREGAIEIMYKIVTKYGINPADIHEEMLRRMREIEEERKSRT